MKTKEQAAIELQGTQFANKKIHEVVTSRMNPSVTIVTFTDGTQTNIPS